MSLFPSLGGEIGERVFGLAERIADALERIADAAEAQTRKTCPARGPSGGPCVLPFGHDGRHTLENGRWFTR